MPPRNRQIVDGLGSQLLMRLRERTMTQRELALRARVSRQTLHRAIHHNEASTGIIRKLASVLGSDLVQPGLRLAAESAAPAVGSTDHGQHAVDDLPVLGAVIEALREDDRWSQVRFVKEAGLSLSTYRRLITGRAKPRPEWLSRLADMFEEDPKVFDRVTRAERGDAVARALGRTLRTWRESRAVSLREAARAVGESPTNIALAETGEDSNINYLELLAPVYGTTADVIFRSAVLSVPPSQRDEFKDRTPAWARILTIEAADAEAEERRRIREDGPLIEFGQRLADARWTTGFTQEDIGNRLGVSAETLDDWEEGMEDPSLAQLEELAFIYRTTPWGLRYGGESERAWEFTRALPCRSDIFASTLPVKARMRVYEFLANVAALGFDDQELLGVRRSLTDPEHFTELARLEPQWHEGYCMYRVRAEAATTIENLKGSGSKGVASEHVLAAIDALLSSWDQADEKQREMFKEANARGSGT